MQVLKGIFVQNIDRSDKSAIFFLVHAEGIQIKKSHGSKKTPFSIFVHSQGKLAKRAKKRKFSEMIKSELFQDNLGPVNPKIILILYFEVIFTPYGPLKGKNLEKTGFFMVNCLGFLYMKFYIINVVIFLNYLFFSIKSFLNHQSKFLGF